MKFKTLTGLVLAAGLTQGCSVPAESQKPTAERMTLEKAREVLKTPPKQIVENVRGYFVPRMIALPIRTYKGSLSNIDDNGDKVITPQEVHNHRKELYGTK